MHCNFCICIQLYTFAYFCMLLLRLFCICIQLLFLPTFLCICTQLFSLFIVLSLVSLHIILDKGESHT